MRDARGVVRFFDRGYIVRFLLSIMLFSLLIIGEIYMVLFLQRYMSTYLIIAVLALISLLFLPLCCLHIFYYIKRVRKRVRIGESPDRELMHFAGSVICGILLVIPGVMSDFVGLLLFFSIPKRIAGYLTMRHYKNRKKEMYEYLKLYTD